MAKLLNGNIFVSGSFDLMLMIGKIADQYPTMEQNETMPYEEQS